MLSELRGRFYHLVKILADGEYRGELIENTRKAYGWVIEIIMRKDKTKKFEVFPQRWIVERTFAWFEFIED